MQVHVGSDPWQPEWPHSVVCIGTFDGVHRGHQAVIRQAIQTARAAELPCALLTFDRHPAAVLAPHRKPPSVGTLAQNLRAFAELGVDLVVLLPFTPELSQTPASEFFERVLQTQLRAKSVVVGHDFAFGNNRGGNAEWLAARIDTQIVAPFELEGVRVSSSAVRAAVIEGRVEQACAWLGRPFALEGIVVSGQKLGRQLGYPTINLAQTQDQVVPAHGIYAGDAQTRFGSFRAAISIGIRPTVEGTTRTIEAFLLDYPGHSLYGSGVELAFGTRLRDEQKFDSLEALKEQMARDVAACLRVE